MSKKQKKATTDEQVSVNEQSTVSETPTAPEVSVPSAAASESVYRVTEAEFKPGKGLAAALYAKMKTLGAATAQQAADALLASGEYEKVAPQAAKLRPVRPVRTLLARWRDQGIVSA